MATPIPAEMHKRFTSNILLPMFHGGISMVLLSAVSKPKADIGKIKVKIEESKSNCGERTTEPKHIIQSAKTVKIQQHIVT